MSIYPEFPINNREKALKVKNFCHYVDSCGDFWFLSTYDRSDNKQPRKELAQLLRKIRGGARWTPFYFMEFYLETFFLPWGHGCSYHDEAKEIFNVL